MLGVRGLLTVMYFFLNIPNPLVAFTGINYWAKKTVYNRLDLCTQACYSQIIPGLYLSNARAARDQTILQHLNISHVLTVETRQLPKSTFANTKIRTLYIRADDTPDTNLLPYFPMANAFINEGIQKGNVIVHCHFGVSRSATIVIAYLMEKFTLTFDQAYAFVRQRRKFINPNPGFVNQLKEYERLEYQVAGLQRLEAYVNVNARKHKFKIVSLAAVVIGIILVPIALLVS